MSAITTRKMTVAEYLAWGERPENTESRDELVEGQVVPMPPPGQNHGVICYLVAGLFFDYFRRHGPGFAMTNDTGLVVAPDTVRGVDVAVFLGSMAGRIKSGYATEMPALCVEVVSPSDRPAQIQKRVKQYHAAGVLLVWVIQPEDKAVMVHRKGKAVELLEGDAELSGVPEFPSFSCRVTDLFPLDE